MTMSEKLITGLCLLTVLVCLNQNAMAVPLNGSNARAIPSGSEYWVNPCGYIPEINIPPVPDATYAETLALRLGVENSYVNNWKNNYSRDKFLMTFDEKVAEDAPFRYDWLQVSTTIPKQPGQHLDDSYYSKKEFNAMLVEFSNIFQRIAIGWEQVTLDSDITYSTDFTSTKNRIKNTLCELDRVLVDKSVPPAPNPTRSIMPNELRTLNDASQRDLRNFRILKEYVNVLEYYADAFAYFAKTL